MTPLEKELLEELKNIANANPSNWEFPDEFKTWAQSRARHAIAKAEASTGTQLAAGEITTSLPLTQRTRP
jgi:hypothetical protein